MTDEELQKRWESLTLADDFLFGKVMKDVELCKEMIRRIFLALDVSGIELVEAQKTEKLDIHLRGVRFDIFTKVARNIFDVEMQKKRKKDLMRRPRAYHTAIGYDALQRKSLKKSGSYEDLAEAYVVFICAFDPFGKKRHMYSFRNYCTEDKDIELEDGGYTVFLNTKGIMNDVSVELKNFLSFVDKNQVLEEDKFIRTLNEKVKRAKENTKWRNEYMVLLTAIDEERAEAREEGFTQGRSEGRSEGIAIGEARGREEERSSIFEKLIAAGMDRLQAASITGVTL